MLTILVNSVSEADGVRLSFLESIPLESATADQITKTIRTVLELKAIPMENTVSILMDSCSVMRG